MSKRDIHGAREKTTPSPRGSSSRLGGLPTRAATCSCEIDPFQDQRELGRLDRARRETPIGGERRVERPSLEALRPHREAVAIPVHDTHAVAALREEDVE